MSPLAAGNGIEIRFPNGTVLVVTAAYWSSQGKWYLNLNAYSTPALEGIMGAIFPGDWLPLMPDGSRLGPRPASVNQRYTDLYDKFGEAWRVKRSASLFDYGPDTLTFCRPAGWPRQVSSCVTRDNPTPQAIPGNVIQQLCAPIKDRRRQADCRFDLRATGERGFARLYTATQQVETGATTTHLTAPSDSSRPGRPLTFTAVVVTSLAKGRVPAGSVQFYVNGERSGPPVQVERGGEAVWKSPILRPGTYRISASFTPPRGSALQPSQSAEVRHVVAGPPTR